jgi:ABC-2 type transport system permease protein
MIAALLWELSRRKMFTMWWTVGITALVALTVLSYLAIKDQADQFNQAFGELSGSAGSFLGGDDLFSPVGYLSSQIYFITLPILLLIMIITLVSSLMNRDENDTTIELTLSRPISRRKVLIAKALAGLVITVVVFAVSYAVTALCVALVDIDISQANVLLTHALSFAFSLSFGVIMFGLIATSRLTKKIAAFVAIFASFGGYILTSLASMVDQFKDLVKIFPYHYYDTEAMLSGKVESGLVIYLSAIVIIMIVIAAIGYNRRDIG